MFAVGAIPDWIPADIRKASLRGQIHTELSPQELQNVAQREGISVEELKKSEDLIPISISKSYWSTRAANSRSVISNSCRRPSGTEAWRQEKSDGKSVLAV
jgi:hypothetical protein